MGSAPRQYKGAKHLRTRLTYNLHSILPVILSVAIDTASASLIVPNSECWYCSGTKYAGSWTSSEVSCKSSNYECQYCYGGGECWFSGNFTCSTSIYFEKNCKAWGQVYQDQLTIGSSINVSITFGTIYDQTYPTFVRISLFKALPSPHCLMKLSYSPC